MVGWTNLAQGGLLRRAAASSTELVVSTGGIIWFVLLLMGVNSGMLLGREMIGILLFVSRIPAAIEIVDKEREILTVEQNAFARFAQKVNDIDSTTNHMSVKVTVGETLSQHAAEAENIRAVRNAYRETVMAMAHYTEEYGEDLQANMAAEFGPAIATAVVEHEELTPELKETLMQASMRATEDRSSLLCQLENEANALSTTEQELTAIEDRLPGMVRDLDREDDHQDESWRWQSTHDIRSAYWRLEKAEDDCKRTLTYRQEQIHQDQLNTDMNLQEYLYGSREWTYPVLDDALDCLQLIQDAKHKLTNAMCRLS